MLRLLRAVRRLPAGRRAPVLQLGLVALAVLAAAGCGGKDDEQALSGPTCGYYYEWKSAWKFALQPDPHAAYTYVIPKVTTDPIGFVINGPFPYAAWTSWTIYDSEGVKPVSLAKDSAITPDEGSVNPFVVGTPVLSPKRTYTLLVVPQGTDTSTIDESLRDIPASNVITSPTSGKLFIIANRVYNAFSGYNKGGAGGSTNTPFPTVKAVNYETGADADCSDYNLLPSPKPPTEMPTNADTRSPGPAAIALTDGSKHPVGPQGSSTSAQDDDGISGAEYAPALDPTKIEFTRPPLLPGADVSSIPPPDNCAGYLGAATSTTQIGLIRMPHVAQWFDTSNLTSTTPFEQEETTYISFTQYGNDISFYDPGSPNTGSLGNAELKVDATGGTTILVWPRSLTSAQQKQVFAYAKQNGWVVMRGGSKGPITTPNLFVRLKGASPSYPGGYTPTSSRKGVPCYFDDNPTASWAELTGDEYVASAENIGSGAPQGVNCSVAEVVGGGCLSRLKAYIEQTGGSYSSG